LALASTLVLVMTAAPTCADAAPEPPLDFANATDADRPWVFWWWLDGAASKEGITRDLEEMKRQGLGGFILVDAGIGGPDAPDGPPFMSEPWRENFRHAIREAARLGLKVSVNLCSGWNAGGPWVQLDDAIKQRVSAEIVVEGPARIDRDLPQPRVEFNWYRDIAVLACPVENGVWRRDKTVDLTSKTRDGRLQWDAPEGRWTILRLGYTMTDGKTGFGITSRTKCSSHAQSEGWEVDPWSAEAMDRHFAATAGKLIEDSGPLTGKTFIQVHIDSWETMQPSWTHTFLEEFKTRRGYDARPFLPALVEKTVDDAQTTARFQWDYQRTAADLFANNYFGRLAKLARPHGLGQDSESGGPFFFHSIDALECEGINEAPMGEFWKRTWEPDGAAFVSPESMGFDTIRQAASAAHIYGRTYTQAEAFTSFSEDWIDDPWCLKDIGDSAFCNGVTRMVMHGFLTQTRLDVVPGNQWVHVGTHINPDVTWWNMSHAWLAYLKRCQYMLRQGRFVADLAYFYGENVPKFVRSKGMITPPVPPGHDFDAINAEVLLTRAAIRDRRLILPDGMSYRYLVLPHEKDWKATPAVLGKIAELVDNGLTVIGPPPVPQAPGLTNYPQCDREIERLIKKLWGDKPAGAGERTVGQGRVTWGKTPAQVIAADRLPPDVEFRPLEGTELNYSKRIANFFGKTEMASYPRFEFIHRRSGRTDIYFVANQSSDEASVEVALRARGRKPELWDAVTATTRDLSEFRDEGGRTFVPMRFAPRESFFVVFRDTKQASSPPESDEHVAVDANFPIAKPVTELTGPWQVSFDPKWGGPAKTEFTRLEDWTKRPEEGIRYYSGTAVYRKSFDLPKSQISNLKSQIYLNLGQVKNVATVKLNGRDLGVVWTAPWRVDITNALQEKGNQLEIAVANLWPNRLIGDAKLPPDKRFTKTNVKIYAGEAPDFGVPGGCHICEERQKTKNLDKSLFPSGLLGPVVVEAEQ
jgi:hypothetical protein